MPKREEPIVRIETRHRLWKEQKGICPYCGNHVDPSKASLDHIIPVNHTEENYGPENLVMTCKRCNKEKLDYIVFTNLYDKVIYPVIDVPFVFRSGYIQKNFKDKKNKNLAKDK